MATRVIGRNPKDEVEAIPHTTSLREAGPCPDGRSAGALGVDGVPGLPRRLACRLEPMSREISRSGAASRRRTRQPILMKDRPSAPNRHVPSSAVSVTLQHPGTQAPGRVERLQPLRKRKRRGVPMKALFVTTLILATSFATRCNDDHACR
jgi:hypothetical protein